LLSKLPEFPCKLPELSSPPDAPFPAFGDPAGYTAQSRGAE
jgi:hypothetical protein